MEYIKATLDLNVLELNLQKKTINEKMTSAPAYLHILLKTAA